MSSDIFFVLKNRFLPPPCLTRQDELTEKLKVVEDGDLKWAQLEPQFQRLVFDLSEKIDGYENVGQIPYDYVCTLIKNQIEVWSCVTCKHYFATTKSTTLHMKNPSH